MLSTTYNNKSFFSEGWGHPLVRLSRGGGALCKYKKKKRKREKEDKKERKTFKLPGRRSNRAYEYSEAARCL